MSTPEHGLRYLLTRQAGEAIVYRGEIVGEGGAWPLVVEVQTEADTPDGLAVSAQSEVPDGERARQEKLAAAMVRAAVRRALKEGLPPPRKINRWRNR